MDIYTRSMNDELYAMMKSCYSKENNFHQLKQFTPHGITALDYLFDIIEKSTADWIVNCDEDCFVSNEAAILDLVEFMKEGDLAFCGMPDGGVCSHRQHSSLTVNPFFNIFNAKKIREAIAESDKQKISNTTYQPIPLPVHIVLADINHDKVKHTNFEVFSGFLFWLSFNFKGLYLDCVNHADGISTVLLDLKGKPFAMHSWYSREFNKGHRNRIECLYNEVKNKHAA